MPKKTSRIEPETIENISKGDFDKFFLFCLNQINLIQNSFELQKQRLKNTGTYSALEFKRTRLLSLNLQNILKAFRVRSIAWEKERSKNKSKKSKSK